MVLNTRYYIGPEALTEYSISYAHTVSEYLQCVARMDFIQSARLISRIAAESASMEERQHGAATCSLRYYMKWRSVEPRSIRSLCSL